MEFEPGKTAIGQKKRLELAKVYGRLGIDYKKFGIRFVIIRVVFSMKSGGGNLPLASYIYFDG